MDREILFENLSHPGDLFKLKDYLRELYRLIDKRHIVSDFSATPTFDCDEADSYSMTMTGNVTGVTLKNPYIGREVTLIFIQDGVGSHTVAWTTTVKLTGAAFSVTATASAASAITLIYDGTNWYEKARALDLR